MFGCFTVLPGWSLIEKGKPVLHLTWIGWTDKERFSKPDGIQDNKGLERGVIDVVVIEDIWRKKKLPRAALNMAHTSLFLRHKDVDHAEHVSQYTLHWSWAIHAVVQLSHKAIVFWLWQHKSIPSPSSRSILDALIRTADSHNTIQQGQ